MKIKIYCVGHLKERYWKEACEEYLKRLQSYADVSIIEVDDEPCKEGSSVALEKVAKDKEGAKILKKIKENDYLCALDLHKKELESEAFSEVLMSMLAKSGSNLSFVIGGSLGLSDELKQRANESISFSKMTFPHQMMRVILLEQIYRGFKIARKEPYHK